MRSWMAIGLFCASGCGGPLDGDWRGAIVCSEVLTFEFDISLTRDDKTRYPANGLIFSTFLDTDEDLEVVQSWSANATFDLLRPTGKQDLRGVEKGGNNCKLTVEGSDEITPCADLVLETLGHWKYDGDQDLYVDDSSGCEGTLNPVP